jgi:diaminohydroxyphosphoribosylaminopyrimidine deaminase/5-amino-6-(5-phosphoribosylamino)uracil reductase
MMARRSGASSARAREREIDRAHMARCLELAARHRGRTAPNPIVGCVIVGRDGEVLAEGAHRGPGQDHAEIAALRKIGRKAPGATLYVNLEPCNHHGRTPPCAPVVREAGVARVVIGSDDPVPGHGGGIELLRRAGITVNVGVLREECERANLPFLTWATQHRPAYTLKAAITLDGKICTVAGQSKWVTGPTARADVMRLRNEHDAVMVGVGTVLADDPWLTARLPGGRDPQRIVLDSQLRTPPSAHLLPKRTGPRTIIVCGAKALSAREKALVARGAEVWRVRTHASGRIDVFELGKQLADAKLCSVLVEGGGEIHAHMIERGLADELVLYIAPKVVGGPAKSWVGGKGFASMGAARRFLFDDHSYDLGGDLRLTARPAPIPEPPEEDLEHAFDPD